MTNVCCVKSYNDLSEAKQNGDKMDLAKIILYYDSYHLLFLNKASSDTAFKHLILHDSTPVSFLSEMHIMNWNQICFMGSFIVQI